MNRRVLIILSVALVVSAAVSYVVYRTVTDRMRAAASMQPVRVVAAARNIEIGTMIGEADLTFTDWVGPLAKGMLSRKEDAIGRGAINAIYEGEPVLVHRLALAGAGAGLAALIPSGRRACAVRVNEVVGLAGFVVSGMRVDVIISGNPPGVATNAGTKVKTVLQNIEVLSAGQNFQRDAEGKPVQVQVVNLLVTPEQAEVLSLASNETRIQLVLRNPLDTEMAQTSGTTMARLFGDEQPAVRAAAPGARPAARMRVAPIVKPVVEAPKAAPQPHLIEVLNGARRTEAKFERQEEKP